MWPRPQPYHVATVGLTILEEGEDFSPLLCAAQTRTGDETLRCLVKQCEETFGIIMAMAVASWDTIFERGVNVPELDSFLSQLELHIALQVEVAQCIQVV